MRDIIFEPKINRNIEIHNSKENLDEPDKQRQRA